jgi:hypothetical protein
VPFQITYEVFFSQPNSFLAIILQLPIPKTRLNSIPLLPSSYPGRMCLETRLTLLNWTLLYNHSARTTQKIQHFYCWEGVFTVPLNSNGSYSIVACVFVAAGMFFPSRCLTMNIYSDVTIPAFGRHITVCLWLTKFSAVHLSAPLSRRLNIHFAEHDVNLYQET